MLYESVLRPIHFSCCGHAIGVSGPDFGLALVADTANTPPPKCRSHVSSRSCVSHVILFHATFTSKTVCMPRPSNNGGNGSDTPMP